MGVSGVGLSWIKFNGSSFNNVNIDEAPAASIKIELPEGKRIIELICVPTHAVYEGRSLRTGVSIDDSLIGIIDVNTQSKTDDWNKNVIRGYSSGKTEFILRERSRVNLELSLLDPGLAVSKILIY